MLNRTERNGPDIAGDEIGKDIVVVKFGNPAAINDAAGSEFPWRGPKPCPYSAMGGVKEGSLMP